MSVRLQKQKGSLAYDPGFGYLGNSPVSVSNYVFQSKGRSGHPHSRALAEVLLKGDISDHYLTSIRLTKFLKQRDLTFQKVDSNGIYRTFSVPVTSSVVPLPKSLFNKIEQGAQVFIFSLRRVLQEIYGSRSLRDNAFVQFLPSDARSVFLHATENSPHYFSMLHHPNMREYPFFDAVGLDLVLVEDYKKNADALPFRLLEINAGSPSGAANSRNILEGMLKIDPEKLDVLGRVMPNDHYSILRETYRSLGESWTGRRDGIQIVLPPGGSNGAAPEIHDLSTYSGLTYCDSGQLYQDEEGFIRMRTVGGENPIVTAIYSRVNSDSALFDPAQGVYLRHPDTGAPIYCMDSLKPWDSGEPEFISDGSGNPLPLESEFAIPGALTAIVNRKLYLGGLNRLLDNKIILPLLSEYAAQFCSHELSRAGLDLTTSPLVPPESLPPSSQALSVIERQPKDWVIKAPNRSGGNGVHVLMTMSSRQRSEVIQDAKKDPTQFAFQKVVKIGRIPVAVKGRHSGRIRFSNRAADLRMWVFFGGGSTQPRLTHNALVRFAPEERGELSSIVNTSQGGGYAPFVVVDDIQSGLSVSGRTAALAFDLAPFQCELPAFVGAQILQCGALISELRNLTRSEGAQASRAFEVLSALKVQVREVISFLHPTCMEIVTAMLSWVEKEAHSCDQADFRFKFQALQAELVLILRDLDTVISQNLHQGLAELKILEPDILMRGYTLEMRKDDEITLSRLNVLILKVIFRYPAKRKRLKRLRDHLNEMMKLRPPSLPLSLKIRTRVASSLDRFCEHAERRLRSAGGAEKFADSFCTGFSHPEIRILEPWGQVKRERAPVTASEWEFKNGKLVTESEHVDPEIKMIRNSWLEVLERTQSMPKDQQMASILTSRIRHFDRFPLLKRLQALIDLESNSEVLPLFELMRVLPYAAYNLRQFSLTKKGKAVQDCFSSSLMTNHIAILNRNQRRQAGLSLEAYSGESFARKRSRHGLISESDRFIWVAKEQSPFTQLYTIGHELIHHEQIQSVMEQEKTAIDAGALAFARFLNFYAHFINGTAPTLEGDRFDVSRFRKPLYGLADRMGSGEVNAITTELRQALSQGRDAYHQVLDRYGGLFGFMMPVRPSIRMKAFKEVIPALENAKNILFAKECGLRVPEDEVKSALPVANSAQCERYRSLITQAAKQWKPDPESFRVIASHQFYGVGFSGAPFSESGVSLEARVAPVWLNPGYNQTDQQ